MKEYLTQSKINKKTLAVENFSKLTSLAINLNVGSWLEQNCKKQLLSYKAPAGVVRGYYLVNTLFLLCADGKLYALQGNAFVHKFNCGNTAPTLAKIKINGEEKALVLTPSSAVVLGDTNQTVSILYGIDACTYNGRIFVANENTLYFGKEFDFANFSVQTGNYNFIKIDQNDGQILRIFDYDKSLLIVCEKALYKLTISSDYDYELDRLYDQNLMIEQGSVCTVGGSIIFISDDKLCVYKNGKVSVIQSIVDNYQLRAQGLAYSGCGKYFLPVTSKLDNQNYIYIYDTINGKECLTEDNCILCGEQYFVDKSSNYVGKLTLEKDTNQGGKWISKKLNFNTNDKKSLLSLSVHLDCDAILLVKGDFGIKQYSLNKGYCKKILNLYSCDFTLEISFDNGDFKAKNLRLEYSL